MILDNLQASNLAYSTISPRILDRMSCLFLLIMLTICHDLAKLGDVVTSLPVRGRALFSTNHLFVQKQDDLSVLVLEDILPLALPRSHFWCVKMQLTMAPNCCSLKE